MVDTLNVNLKVNKSNIKLGANLADFSNVYQPEQSIVHAELNIDPGHQEVVTSNVSLVSVEVDNPIQIELKVSDTQTDSIQVNNIFFIDAIYQGFTLSNLSNVQVHASLVYAKTSDGLVSDNIAVISVNDILPDNKGNVNIIASDIPDSVLKVNGILPDNTGLVTLAPSDVGAISITEKGADNGVATLDSTGKIPSIQLPELDFVEYKGAWDASTNTPPIPAASSENKGWYYIVSVAGNTPIDGNSIWGVGDWLVSDGTKYDKIDNQATVINDATTTSKGIVQIGDGLTVNSGLIAVDQSILSGLGFTPQNTIYVAQNGDAVKGNGNSNNPFININSAISASSNGDVIYITSPGIYSENITLIDGTWLVGPTSPSGKPSVVIQGNVNIQGSGGLANVEINYSSSTIPALNITSPGINNFCVSNVRLTTNSTSTALSTSSSASWSSKLIAYDLWVPSGKILFDIGTGNVEIHDLPVFSTSILEIKDGRVDLSKIKALQRIDHEGGQLYIYNAELLGTSAVSPAINSTANDASGVPYVPFLYIGNVNTFISTSIQSYVTKTGTCKYAVSNLTRNISKDNLTNGIQSTVWKHQSDQDVIGTVTPSNYAILGNWTRDHFYGIDQALGLRLQTIKSLGNGNSLVVGNNGVASIAAGSGITASLSNNTLTISSTITAGVNTLNSLSGNLNLIGSGIGITPSGSTITLTNSGITGLNSRTGNVNITAGTGITVTTNSNTISIANSGLASLTDAASVVGANSLIFSPSGVMKVLQAGSNININDANGVLTLNANLTSGVKSLNSASGDLTIVGSGATTVTQNGSTITVSSAGGTAAVASVNGLSGTISIAGNEGITVTPDSTSGNVNIGYSIQTIGTGVNLVAGNKIQSLIGDGVNLSSDGNNITISSNAINNIDSVGNNGALSLINNGNDNSTAHLFGLKAGANISITTDNTNNITLDVVGGAGTVKSVNNITVDNPTNGNVELTATDVNALAITGGQMQGAVSMNSFALTNLIDPVNNQDPVTLHYLNSGNSIDAGTF